MIRGGAPNFFLSGEANQPQGLPNAPVYDWDC